MASGKAEGLRQTMTEIVTEQLGCRPEQVTDEASLENDLGADSLDRVALLMAVEEEYALEVPDETAESWDTFGKALEGVAALLP